MTESISLHWIDWTIILAYICFSLGVGIYFSKRAASSTEEYFLSGRTLPWWIVGTSMVATTFAADTPLAITEFVRGQGIWKNWFYLPQFAVTFRIECSITKIRPSYSIELLLMTSNLIPCSQP